MIVHNFTTDCAGHETCLFCAVFLFIVLKNEKTHIFKFLGISEVQVKNMHEPLHGALLCLIFDICFEPKVYNKPSPLHVQLWPIVMVPWMVHSL